MHHVRFKVARSSPYTPITKTLIPPVVKHAPTITLNSTQLHVLRMVKDQQLQELLTKFLARCKGQSLCVR